MSKITTVEELHKATWPLLDFEKFMDLFGFTSYPIALDSNRDPWVQWGEQLLDMKAEAEGDYRKALLNFGAEFDNAFRHTLPDPFHNHNQIQSEVEEEIYHAKR